MRYDHQAVEKKWRKYWDDNKTFATPTDRTRPKFYVLDMFPYPSRHGASCRPSQGIRRHRRRRPGQADDGLQRAAGHGLGQLRPARRAPGRARGHPSPRGHRAQHRHLQGAARRSWGCPTTGDRELATSDDPAYYRWTQWIFLELYEQGLAYQREVPVNWCPALGTVLSNEEVVDGKYVETGDPVERRA